MKKLMAALFFACAALPSMAFETRSTNLKFSTDLQDAVIQVIASRVEFNWVEPYRAPEVSEMVGSGFFIDTDGYALTNYHVVEQCTENGLFVRIQSMGNQFLRAEIVGVCPDIDVALIKVCDEGLDLIRQHCPKQPYFQLGDSDDLLPMDPIAAVGYPMGQRYVKITTGVVAGRDFNSGSSFLHITAPINPGNSGGPALDRFGRVIGINTALHAQASNIGYIIPIKDVETVLGKLRGGEFCRKPKLGIIANLVTDEHALILGSPAGRGYFVTFVMQDSLAWRLGLRENDVVVQITVGNEVYEVDNYGDISVDWPSAKKITAQELLMRVPEGEHVALQVWRRGECIKLTGMYNTVDPVSTRLVHSELEPHEIDYEMVGGAVFMQLRENHLLKLANARNLLHSLPENSTEPVLIITSVLPSSEFHKLRCIMPGMLLDTVNGVPVRTLKELREVLRNTIEVGYISLRTKDPIETVVSWDKVLQDEFRLSRSFGYLVTPFVQTMHKARFEKPELGAVPFGYVPSA